MNASIKNLNPELQNTLGEIFTEARKEDPDLSDQMLLSIIVTQWLERYRIPAVQTPLKKDDALLKNDLRRAIAISGKNQTEIANEIGLDRTYLNQLINGKYEPSMKLGLLLCRALGYPSARIEEIFFLSSSIE